MKKYLLVFVAIVLSLTLLFNRSGQSAEAQDDLTSAVDIPAVNAAIEAINRIFPGIGQPHLFTYSFTEPTRDSSLGCPLLEGFVMSTSVVAYRVILSYGDRQYTYHATTDGSLVFPCDEQLPVGGPLPEGSTPFAAAAVPAQAAIEALLRTAPSRGFPHSYSYTFTTATTDSSLGCPRLDGFGLGQPVAPYRVVLSYPDAEFVYHVAGDRSILFPCDEKLSIGGPLAAGREPFRPVTPVEAALDVFAAAFPNRVFPDRYEYLILDPVIDGPRAECPDGATAVDVATTPYRITLYSLGVPYVYFAVADGTAVIACDS